MRKFQKFIAAAIVTVLLAWVIILPVYYTDQKSGSVKEVRGLLFPYHTRFVFKAPDFDQKSAFWESGAPVAFHCPIAIKDIICVSQGQMRRCFRLRSITPPAHFEWEVLTENGEWNLHVTNNTTISANGIEVGWNPRDQTSAYLWADDYITLSSNRLYRVSYPVSFEAALLFLVGKDTNLNWYAFPWDGNCDSVERGRLRLGGSANRD